MIKKNKIYLRLIIALMTVISFNMHAQEQLMPLSANNGLTSLPEEAPLASRTSSIVVSDTIPFFDDFSYSPKSSKPTINHWLDSGGVFVNHTFPIAPISIGVATFDGLNKKGYPYNISALASSSSPADKLISRPINLQLKGTLPYQPSDSTYLSFYYQAKGRGDAPEANDSLSVDFYKPNQRKWVKVWGRKGYNPIASDSLFHLVMLPVKDSAYFDSLFQFRFRNNATLSGSLDHWHVDYVYLDRRRAFDDSLKQDIAFEYMSTPFLKNYSVMPYEQYVSSEMATTHYNYIRNNYIGQGQQLNYRDTVYNQNNVAINTYTNSNNNIYPYSVSGTGSDPAYAARPVSFAFPPMTGNTTFTIKHMFNVPTFSDVARNNDTLIQTQAFSNYYAHDDGTAEVGYYNNTYGAKIGVNYTINKDDTLGGMRIYFDPITDGLNIMGSSFRMMVWKDTGNGPGEVFYRDSMMYPTYLQGSYNLMPIYKLSGCKYLPPASYYFGIQQTTNKPLNIGFDKNNDHSTSLFYDVGSGWTQSAIKGSLMINPIMGCSIPLGIDNMFQKQQSVTLFPNPAQNSVSIETNGLILEKATVTIFSSLGQTVYSSPFIAEETIDTGSLPNGIYFVQLSGNTLNITPQKLIIYR